MRDWIEPLPPTVEAAQRVLSAFAVASRYRNPQTGRRHFCHLLPYRPHFVRRVKQLRAFVKGATQ